MKSNITNIIKKDNINYSDVTNENYEKLFKNNTIVYLDLELSKFVKQKKITENIGRLEILLYTEESPYTCENFRTLCTGELNYGYEGKYFKKPNSNFFIQGLYESESENSRFLGSIYKKKNFLKEESKKMFHNFGTLSMLNGDTKYSTNSQFIISFQKLNWLNGLLFVFGKVIRGNKILREIYNLQEKEFIYLKVIDSGQLCQKDYNLCDNITNITSPIS